ncbi:MAG: gamma-glutamyl-gamma-aminobutyrate hydrolase family protein, partial [Burkholderiaceae bacterium]
LHPFHCVGDKYVQAILAGAHALPILIPAVGDAIAVEDLLEMVDGLVFTGSPSNVAPERYGHKLRTPELAELLDPWRDATTLPLIPAAIHRGIPVLGICRGFQEMNVAYGGTLLQAVQDEPGRIDHREDLSASLEIQYGEAHPIQIVAGGQLAEIAGTQHARVNSLHSQGIEHLGSGLRVEATAPDGLIEAFSVIGASEFALAVQWHPEWHFQESPLSIALFGAFGRACKRRRSARGAIP